MTGRISNYQISLVETLSRIHLTELMNLADFTIYSENGEEIHCHKLLLAARSKYFEALFRQEPQRTNLKMNFEFSVIKAIVKSLVNFDLNQYEENELQSLLEASDYLQMDALTKELESALTKKLCLDNVYDIVEFIDNLQVDQLKSDCSQFIKQNILQLDLKEIPRNVLKTLTSTPTGHIKDQHGRLYDLIESELILFEVLTNLDPEEDWNFSNLTQKRLFFALSNPDSKVSQNSAKLIRKLDFEEQKNNKTYGDQFDTWVQECKQCTSERKKTLTLGKFGSATDVLQTSNLGSLVTWSFQGMIRKISLKTRTWELSHIYPHSNDTQDIIQGMKIELDDGTVQAFGMDTNDQKDVVDLKVPNGQHIQDVTLRNGWYIDQMIFRTNENFSLGPVGGSGGSIVHIKPNVLVYQNAKQWYLNGIKGITVQTQGAPCIAQLEFTFVVIEDPEPLDTSSDDTDSNGEENFFYQ